MKRLAVLAFGAMLFATSSGWAQLTITTARELGAVPYTPSWSAAADSLIGNLAPTLQAGNFGAFGSGGDATNLTKVGVSLTVNKSNGQGNDGLEICGSSGGTLLVYTLPITANGYDITNISVYGGWQDAGRDRQDYTISYSTAADPTNYIYLTTVRYNPDNPTPTGCATRVAITDALGGTIAKSVAGLRFNFLAPPAENNGAGYTAITVQGTAASSLTVPAVSISTANQTNANAFTPDWVVETDSLISGQAPTAAVGNFLNSNTGGTPVLTDGTIGDVTPGVFGNFASCGASSGTSLVYTLTNSVNGSDITNIVLYSGWQDNGRFGQYYVVSYSTVTAPTTFVPITTVFYLPPIPGSTRVAARVAIRPLNGQPLGKNVASIKFDFAAPTLATSFNNGWQGYSEIIVEGTNSAPPTLPPSPYLTQDTLPTYAETVVGDQVVLTADFSNSPPASLQWKVIKGGVTNSVPGATGSTLTLNNVQISDSGSYYLRADNATNGTAMPSFSRAVQVVVGATPAPINNVIVNYAGQSFPSSTNFFPAWLVDTNSLVYGFTYGFGPGTFVSVGDFSGGPNVANPDPTILTDGMGGSIPSVPSTVVVAGGPTISSVGSSVTYTLFTNTAPFGYELTNIMVFGGWQDPGRNEQKYQILYATATAPTVYVPLLTADYNPGGPAGQPSVTRTKLTPASGVLAHNVVGVKLSFDVSPAPKNGWEGYTEFIAQGTSSLGIAPNFIDIVPQTAVDIVGSQIVISGVFSNYNSLQWQKNGTNIPGETSLNLTLSNLSTNDAATYVLVASNPAGSTSSGSCVVKVNPVPTPVGNAVVSIAAQTSDSQTFVPTWSTSAFSSSLLFLTLPSAVGIGDFMGGTFGTTPTAASDSSILTDGTFGTADFYVTTTHYNWTAMGSGTGTGNLFGGHFVTYTLSGAPNGYTITNIVTGGGWNDGGRDQQAYTVSYSTMDNPDIFLPIAVVNYNPSGPVGYSLTRATITPVNGALATNVAMLKFDMTSPAGENGFSGYSEFAVYGSPSPTPPPVGPVITAQNEQGFFDYVVETPNLVANRLPSSTGPGIFTEEGCNVTNLTDGIIGFGFAFGASCGNDGVAVSSLTFNSSSGWNLSNIVVYSLWNDYGRDGQFYNLSYSTLSAPSTFVPLASVIYNPDVPRDGTPSANRVQIAPALGQDMLATNVYAVKFDFTPQGIMDFGWSGYSEIVLLGAELPPPAPPVLQAATISGGNLILTGTGAPNYSYTVLTTTNIATPTANWTVYTNGASTGAGVISNAIPINPNQPKRFFRLQAP